MTCLASLSSRNVPITHLIIAVPVCGRGFVPVVLASLTTAGWSLGAGFISAGRILPTYLLFSALESLDSSSSGLGSVGGAKQRVIVLKMAARKHMVIVHAQEIGIMSSAAITLTLTTVYA